MYGETHAILMGRVIDMMEPGATAEHGPMITRMAVRTALGAILFLAAER
jgi:hypothetical protein